ncbi:MAG: peptide-methionine (S)-S-oxide reductase MsrA [Alphaproteobacteria bacterium]|nr:peptide-methionine (S)-S-oxide reductase MsrA [Alphaproteobacteria bacterium]
MAKAMFGAGCFWGIEEAFRAVPGVADVAVGYSGGTVDNPGYEAVCTGRTGHAEVVEVIYDEAAVSYEDLLETFWGCHDPTQLDRQGPDIGTQYRSAIFPVDADQEQAARTSLASEEESGRHRRPIVTRIEPAGPFWRAEEYHQQYIAKRRSGFRRLFG